MVRIRLARIGTRKRPCHRVVVTDVRNARDGKFIERVGFLDMSHMKYYSSSNIFLDLNRINYWIQKGAVVSNRVGSLIKNYKKKGMLLH